MEQSGKKVTKSDEQWREQLSDEEFRVCREQGTEPPFSGKLLHNKETGVYACTCCNAPLFVSDNKYDSGCGWPSFDESIDGAVAYVKDTSHGMIRTEILCASCGSHLGHVFNDGPTATGQRYCVNSLSVDLEKK